MSKDKYDVYLLTFQHLVKMKNVGIECNIPPNQLRQGYGTPICIVLLSLVDKVIKKIVFSFKKPNKDNKKKGENNKMMEQKLCLVELPKKIGKEN